MDKQEELNILIVDDKEENLFSLEIILENPGITIIKAKSGREALLKLMDYDFALVILDVMMPDMNGFEVARLMKANHRTRFIPIIFITALNHDHSRVLKGYEAGAVDYLHKPIIPEILVNKVKVFTDIYNQRKRIEFISKRLTESEKRYQTLIDAAGDAIFVADANDEIIVDVNKKAEELIGFSKYELIGLHFKKIHPSADTEQYEKLFRECVKNRKCFKDDLLVRHKNGVHIPVEIHSTVIDFEGKELIIGIFREISERKRVEKELKEYRYHLEELVEKRTSELKRVNRELEKEVREKKRMETILKRQTTELSRSNKELEHFAYIASHDLQEPLRKVSNFTDLLAKRYRKQMDPKADKFIDYIIDGAARMRKLINDLLLYSRIGTEGKSFQLTDCSKVLDIVEQNLQIAINETKATVTKNNLPRIEADGTQLMQLFQNLINNAIKFRSDKSPQIHVEAKKILYNKSMSNKGVEKREGLWLFSVKDNGIGIHPESFERIFMMFQRLHGRGEYEGTGIGLALCKKIVERHDGRIWVESEEGKGTTFYFELPETTETG